MGRPEIPDKTYFKIGEVCDLTGIKTHTLRYWESEFPVIKPLRAGSQQRLYRRADVDVIFKIKQLIYEDGLTIAGARKFLTQESKSDLQGPHKQIAGQNLLLEIKEELIAIRNMMK